MSSYNSLKDPHLNSYFRKPQIRHHLLKANIITKDNEIVQEISTTKHRQDVERKQKRELYQVLDGLVRQNFGMDNTTTTTSATNRTPVPVGTNKDTILDYARSAMIDSDLVRTGNQRQMLLHKLDRMIRVIKEHNEVTAARMPPARTKSLKSNLRPTKSMHDVSTTTTTTTTTINPDSSGPTTTSSSVSTPQLLAAKNYRPKSSYGRSRMQRNVLRDQLDLSRSDTLKKCTSLATVTSPFTDSTNEDLDDIKSLDGQSFDDEDCGSLEPTSFPLLRTNYVWAPVKSVNSSLISPEIVTGGSKKYYAFEKRFVRINSGRESRVKITLQYNGLTEATNRGQYRNIKVNQQITVGGNSILIYDGRVKPGGSFTFGIRPHVNNSFAITVLVNGIRDLRLNTCCEHKHRPGTRLAHFIVVDIVGGRPCFACQMMADEISANQNGEHTLLTQFNSKENHIILDNRCQEQGSPTEDSNANLNDDDRSLAKNNDILLKPWDVSYEQLAQSSPCLVRDIDEETIPSMLTSDSEQEY